MEKIFQTILEMSLFAVPVILILAICSNLLGKRYGARWRYLVWLVDTALRADTAEPAGANGDNAGTGAFGAEQHTRGTGAENTGLFCAEGYGRADRAGNADCPCGADTGGKRGKEGCL